MKYAIGLDLGGTKIAAALVNNEGRIIHYVREPTPQASDYHSPKKHIRAVVEQLLTATTKVYAKAPPQHLLGIGLASAGPLNVETGQLIFPANFAGWKCVPIIELLKESLQTRKMEVPLRFQNDAMAAALGEGWRGAAQTCHTFVAITVGTGIGTGVIVNGKICQSRGMGSEWGHQLVTMPKQLQVSDLNNISVEGIASGTGLLRRARAKGFKGSRVEELVEKIKQGDDRWNFLFEDAAQALAGLLYNLSLGFHPQKFVISGGMIGIYDLFLDRTQSLYHEWIQAKNPSFEARVSLARLGTRAGVLGAARLMFLKD